MAVSAVDRNQPSASGEAGGSIEVRLHRAGAGGFAALYRLTPRATIRARLGVLQTTKRGKMRQVALILAVIAALAVPVGAQAATTVELQQQLDRTFFCNGELIQIAGTYIVIRTDTITPTGQAVLSYRSSWQNVDGVNLTTGARYEASGTGSIREVYSNVNPPYDLRTETSINHFHLQGTAGASSIEGTELLHFTILPDGTVAVSFDSFTHTC